jgi:hypothetical protein
MTPVLADASSTVGLAIILGVTGVMIWVTLGALERRRRAARVRRGPLGRGDLTARAPNTAAEIEDAGQVPVMELLGALRVREADELDEEGEFNIAPGLGLKLHEGDTGYQGSGGRPTVMEGSRNGHQAFIRLGMIGDEDSPGIGFRKFRFITAIRVEAPDFELNAAEGALEAGDEAPAAVQKLIGGLSPSSDVWHDLRIVAGDKGMVASRGGADDVLGGWAYDLWLLERLATELGAEPLSDIRLRRDWRLPYDMGDWSPGLFGR